MYRFILLLPFFFNATSYNDILLNFYLVILIQAVSFYSKILFIFLIIYLNFLSFVVVHIVHNWGRFNRFTSIIEVVNLSPLNESFEYLGSKLSYVDFISFCYSSVLIFITVQLYKSSFNYSKAIKLLFFLCSFFLIISASFLRGNIFKKFPLSIIYDIIDVYNIDDSYQQRNEYLKKIKPKNIDTFYDKVILIMGESANKNYISLYDSTMVNTPFLLSKKDSLYIFNSISPANQTHLSIPISLTPLKYDSFSNFFETESIVTSFKTNGYDTSWISNQEGLGGGLDSAISSISFEAKNVIHHNFEYILAKPDSILLKAIKEISLGNKKLFSVIHLMGSHLDYSKRHDNKNIIHKNPLNKIHEYENTIYYTDYILKEIFKIFSNNSEKILIIYTSDHGESVSEFESGHGYFIPFQESYEVPLIFYSNRNNQRLDSLSNINKDFLFNNESLYDIILYVSHLSEKMKISNSNKVISSDTKSVFDYSQLKRMK